MRIGVGRVVLVALGVIALSSCQAGPASPPATPAASIVSPTAEGTPPEATCFQPSELLPIAFMPTGKRLVLRASSGVQVVDLATGREVLFVASPTPPLTAAISPDGQRLAWSFQDGTIQIIEISDQAILASFQGHPDPVYDLQFSPDGESLLSASHDGVVRIWDLAGSPIGSIDVGLEVLGFGVSADGSLLAVVPSDGPVQLWDMTEAKKIKDLGGTGGYDTSDAHFSPDGSYLAADLAAGLFLWRVSDGRLLWNDVKNSMAVAFSPDGRYLAYSNVDDGNSVVLASPDATQSIRTVDRMQSPIWEMFFSPDGSMLAATDGVEIRIWSVPNGTLLYVGQSRCPR